MQQKTHTQLPLAGLEVKPLAKSGLAPSLIHPEKTGKGAEDRPHANTKHGMAYSKEYSTYGGMIQRCYNPNHTHFQHYGGRGISVCERWLYGNESKSGFECFFEDIGPIPENLTIDRFPDNDGNYEPNNLRLATKEQQSKNRRNIRLLTLNGQTKCVRDWERFLGFARGQINQRLKYGWDIKDVLSSTRYKNKLHGKKRL